MNNIQNKIREVEKSPSVTQDDRVLQKNINKKKCMDNKLDVH